MHPETSHVQEAVIDLNSIEDDVKRVQSFKSVDNQPQFFDIPFLQLVLLILSNTVVFNCFEIVKALTCLLTPFK